MKNTLETRLGLFVALALIALAIIFEMIGGFDGFKKGYPLRAQFDNVQELKPGDPVKIAGVEIGRVSEIGISGEKAEVTMRISGPPMIRTSSKASVRFSGLMGQNYVAIEIGQTNAPFAAENALLQTSEQPDLNSLMAKLENVATGVENLTHTFSGDSFNNLLGPFTDFLKENNPRLTGILSNMHRVSDQIASGQGTIGKLIYEDELHSAALATVTNLNEAAGDIRSTLASAQAVVDQVNSGQGTIGRLIKEEALYNETTNAMTNLKEILQKINQGQGSVGKLVNDETLYRNIKLTLQKVEKATEGLEDQGPLSVLGVAVNSLF